MKMPKEALYGTRTNMTLKGLSKYGEDHDGELMGLRLPPFQRPAVWTEAQKVRFIESAWLGFSLGEVVITQVGDLGEFDALVIDGQQRLTAVRDYFRGDFAVFGARWAEVDERDQRHFGMNVTIGVVWLSRDLSWDYLRELYIRMNYGGTAHAAEHHPDVLDPDTQK